MFTFEGRKEGRKPQCEVTKGDWHLFQGLCQVWASLIFQQRSKKAPSSAADCKQQAKHTIYEGFAEFLSFELIKSPKLYKKNPSIPTLSAWTEAVVCVASVCAGGASCSFCSAKET